MEDDMSQLSPLWNNFQVRVPEEGKHWMDRPITVEELKGTVKAMARGKASGDDGLPIEFFACCWQDLAEDLVTMFNEILTGGKLGQSMTRGVISLLFKKGDRSEVRNWCPISLLNVVSKLLAKTLATRLRNRLPGLVKRDQGAFVQGRSIFEDMVTAIEALELIERDNAGVAVLLLDLEKAYNRVALEDCSSAQEALLQEKLKKRVTSWGKARHLSLIGRAPAITASAFALLWYVTVIQKFSPTMLRTVKAVARRFIWKSDGDPGRGYMSKVAWDTICAPKEEGGLSLLDPGAQNKYLLARWVVKVAEADSDGDWILLAEALLASEWKLTRPSDVWVAIMTKTFAGKRPNSRFWWDVLAVWKQARPTERLAPKSKEDVRCQPLFENDRITDVEGAPFTLERKPGTFGLSWLQKGISLVGDLWDANTNQWKSDRLLRQVLGQLPLKEERAQMLRAAIPEEWKLLLGPAGIDPPGTWYKWDNGEEEWYCRLESWFDDGSGRCWLET
ncbi:hypothetical protein CBR_g45996 [Chara braunii]|uniref:Uncharacterized protein n=1 Tax=Chara braunii TaxID=69332 RepID=A0A388LZU2_CHABU|nr:hypothetical protein CBR_g45996 [Chara braunii]|eukprot:GBG87840.1 hypothetical protein CBR_g45996 [Chara braunii]